MIVVLTIVSFLAACSNAAENSQEEGKKHINYLYNFSTNSLDPHVDSSYVPLRAGNTGPLVKLDEKNLTIAPWLAEDGIHWTIHLREGVTFHNGKEMDAKAVKASLERALQESVAIQNALKIDTIEADGFTPHITTKQPFPEFVSELVNPNVSIIDVSEEDIVNHPVGTGPFSLTSFEPGSKLELERYDQYWDGPSNLDSVTFSFHESSQYYTHSPIQYHFFILFLYLCSCLIFVLHSLVCHYVVVVKV